MEVPKEKIPNEHTDTTYRSLADLPAFLKLLKSVIDTFPPIIKNAPWSDVAGKAFRKWSKYALGRDTIAGMSIQYRELLAHYTRMLELGEATRLALLPSKEDDTQTQAKYLLLMLENIDNPGSLTKPFLDYLAACTTLELIRPSIPPLLKTLESNGHIKQNEAFILALKNMEDLASVGDNTNEPINGEHTVLQDYAERCNIAKLSQLVRILSVFSTKKLLGQDISQKENQFGLGNGGSNSNDVKVKALREFNALFGLYYLGKLLSRYRAWEQGKSNSLQTLEQNINHLFVLSEANLVDIPMIAVNISDEELQDIAQSIQLFMSGDAFEDELPDALKSPDPALAPIAIVRNPPKTDQLRKENDETPVEPIVDDVELAKLIGTLSNLPLSTSSDDDDQHDLPLGPKSVL